MFYVKGLLQRDVPGKNSQGDGEVFETQTTRSLN